MVGDNPAMQRRLLEKFLVGAEDQVTQIAAATAINDTATAANVAHALKSAARTVGALRLGDLCEQLETAGHAGEATLCRTLAEDVSAVLAVAAERIEKALVAPVQKVGADGTATAASALTASPPEPASNKP
jgi:HPt (histidine-containing phosphotransfer) domain-containing protein